MRSFIVMLMIVAAILACGEIPRPPRVGGMLAPPQPPGTIQQADGGAPEVPEPCPRLPAEDVAWVCDKTIRFWCAKMEECGEQTFAECYEHAEQVVCRYAVSVRDACELTAACWPWIRGLRCDVLRDPEFRGLPPSCRGQFSQGLP